jgi:putative sterol carrier protein
MAEQQVDLTEVTPDQFAELIAQSSDQEIAETIHAVGTGQTLTRIFEGFKERFRADKAQGVDEDVQFVVTDAGEEHPYSVSIKDGSCTTKEGRVDDPKTTLTTDLVSFCKLIAGQADGVRLFMSGKLKVSGDLMFAQRIMTFFDRPGASSS